MTAKNLKGSIVALITPFTRMEALILKNWTSWWISTWKTAPMVC